MSLYNIEMVVNALFRAVKRSKYPETLLNCASIRPSLDLKEFGIAYEILNLSCDFFPEVT